MDDRLHRHHHHHRLPCYRSIFDYISVQESCKRTRRPIAFKSYKTRCTNQRSSHGDYDIMVPVIFVVGAFLWRFSWSLGMDIFPGQVNWWSSRGKGAKWWLGGVVEAENIMLDRIFLPLVLPRCLLPLPASRAATTMDGPTYSDYNTVCSVSALLAGTYLSTQFTPPRLFSRPENHLQFI